MSTRRTFIKQASLATTGLLMNKSAFFKKQQLIGLQLYTLRNVMGKDIPGTIAKVAEIGYTSVEPFGYASGKYFGMSVEDFAAIFKQNNLKTPSGHYTMMDFLLKGDEDQLKKTVADAAKMNHEFFVIPYLTDNLRTSLDDYKKLAVKLNRAGEEAKSAGMQLAYHNHDFEFKDWGDGKTGFEVLRTETDHKLVSFEMDMYWVSRAGHDPIELIKSNKGRFKLWHIKDMANTPQKEFTEVGSGVINYKEIFKYQKESGMKYFYVEQDQVKIPVYDSITQSLAYLKKNILS